MLPAPKAGDFVELIVLYQSVSLTVPPYYILQIVFFSQSLSTQSLFLAQLKTKEGTYKEWMKTKEEKDTEKYEVSK